MDNIAKSIIDASKEKIRNPFLGAFMFTFVIYNWKKVAVFILSNKDIEDRISIIIKDYNFFINFIIPLAISIVLIFAFQVLNLLIEKYSSKIKKERKNILLDLLKHELERKKAIANLEGEIIAIKTHNQEMKNLIENVNSLEGKVNLLENEKKETQKVISQKDNTYKNTLRVNELLTGEIKEHKSRNQENFKYINEYFHFRNSSYFNDFLKMAITILNSGTLPENKKSIEYFSNNNYIIETKKGYEFTHKGEYFYDIYLHEKLYSSN
ncbi:hypothetical protein [Tenacibaculum sp. 47A_GOM-205m]|uniref:hypothetical protein n=1 Tax=Tenacibaculum sp. 47A_GOM-205m TaxID=1380384 RepID=UPI0004913FE0|nr:hypothetical protein [Tenacibaculum sp. 47A_GOM-205m]